MPKKLSNEEFLERLQKISGNKISILENYQTSRSPILVKCNNCGHEWKIKPNDLLQGKGCSICWYNSLKITNEKFIERIKNIHGNKVIPLEQYKSYGDKIKFKCEYGHIWNATPDRVTSGTGCPYCAKRADISYEDFLIRIKDIFGNIYTPLEKNKRVKDKIKIHCNLCNNNWETTPNRLLYSKSGCPNCKTWKGEEIIKSLLEENSIKFKRQYTFKNLKGIGGGTPRFDFGILNDKNELLYLIEYDGELHEQSVDYFGGEETLDRCIENDKIKNKYSVDNNIPLIRIPYTHKENIILDDLNVAKTTFLINKGDDKE